MKEKYTKYYYQNLSNKSHIMHPAYGQYNMNSKARFEIILIALRNISLSIFPNYANVCFERNLGLVRKPLKVEEEE